MQVFQQKQKQINGGSVLFRKKDSIERTGFLTFLHLSWQEQLFSLHPLNGFLLEIYEPIHHCLALKEPYPFPEQRKRRKRGYERRPSLVEHPIQYIQMQSTIPSDL
jgi:hypothetical protein